MTAIPRRLAAAAIAAALVALVVLDLTAHGFRVWFYDHSLTSSIVSSLLVLGVTALIVDEVVARRQRKDRANSVAVQAVIVYDQAERTYSAVLATLDEAGEGADDDAREELRALANMLLTSSPNLFDDPDARIFLENVQRLTGVMFRASSSSLIGHAGKPSRESITTAMDGLHASATPLIQRLSAGYRAAIDEPA
jgi:ABC-type protease/lipase transport system fused ATPase/permease subunit